MTRYVIIGSGAAGLMAAQTIRTQDPDGIITMLTDEGYAPYYRPGLPEMMAHKKSMDDLQLRPPQWYEKKKISLKTNTRADRIDPQAKRIFTPKGDTFEYDKLLLACGGTPLSPPIDGCNSRGVFTVRTASDVDALVGYMDRVTHLAVIGGGLLGLEAAHSLATSRRKVTVIERAPRLLPKQLDDAASARLKNDLEQRGFEFILSDNVTRIEETTTCNAITLAHAEGFHPQAVLICVGIQPSTQLARDAGIDTNRGVCIDEYLHTDTDSIWCAGDMAEYDGRCGGLWTIAMQQGKLVGANMAGEHKPYGGSVAETTLKVTGIDMFSSGIIDAPKDENGYEKITWDGNRVYRALLLHSGVITGCLLFGDTSNKSQLSRCVREKVRPSLPAREMLSPHFDEWDTIF